MLRFGVTFAPTSVAFTSVSRPKKFVFGVFLVPIFPHLDWLLRFTPHISVFSPSEGKCRTEKLRTRILFTQCVSLRWNFKHTDSLDSNSSFIFICIEISKSWHKALTRSSKKNGIQENMIKINLVFLISLLFANLDRSLRLLLEFFVGVCFSRISILWPLCRPSVPYFFFFCKKIYRIILHFDGVLFDYTWIDIDP